MLESPPSVSSTSKKSWPTKAAERSQSPPAPNLRWPAFNGWALMGLPLLLLFVAPVLILLGHTSPQQIWLNLNQPKVWQAIQLSLTTSLMSVLVSFVFGLPLAYWLSQKQGRLRRLLDTLIDLPMILPPAVAGLALLLTFGRRGPLGGLLAEWGIEIVFTPVAVVLAQTFVAAPFFIKAAMIGFAAVDPDLKKAAALDGANGWQVFRFITVPLTWTAIFGGAVMTWARAIGEFGATIIFAGNYPGRTQTMPLAIYLGFELDWQVALTLAAILVGCSFFVLLTVKVFLQRDQLF